MEWFLDRRDKSLAASAQRVVADMHRHIEEQNEKMRQLQGTMSKFESICTESLEKELERLAERKSQLIKELEETDESILQKEEELKFVKEEVAKIGQMKISPFDAVSAGKPDTVSTNLEEQYIEETEMFASIKDMDKKALFIINRNRINEVVIFTTSEDRPEDIARAYKLVGSSVNRSEVSQEEKIMVSPFTCCKE